MTTDLIDPFKTSEDVREMCRRVTKSGECPTYAWPSNLFGFGKEGYDHTIDYLMQRFRRTEDMQEYYCCIPYLYKDITAEELFVPWHLSPNYASAHTNPLPNNITHVGKRRKSSEGQTGHSYSQTNGTWW